MKLFITGSYFYDHEALSWETVSTEYGKVEWLTGEIHGEKIIILPRHGKNHKNLPHHINYLANFSAIEQVQPEYVVSFSVCGLLNENIPLAKPMIANDFFFPDNRLPDGSICTVFQKSGENHRRGHLITTGKGGLCNAQLQTTLTKISNNISSPVPSGVYVHANGPRFNSKLEIQMFKNAGGDFISQTCGPEVIMANELNIPFALVCFGVDYANGISKTPTPLQILSENLERSNTVFKQIIDEMMKDTTEYSFDNFVWEL